jgi:branched-chain amino acid transport system permease protein
VTDPMAGVDPPPATLVGSRGGPPVSRATARASTAVAALVATAALAICAWVLDDFWLGLVASGVALAVVMLSVVLTVGVGRTISLCQGTFAAVGAFATAQLVQHDWPVLVAMGVGAAVAAAVAAVLAFPVIRLPGIYAALATLAFALMFEGVLVPLGWVSGGSTPLEVPRPVVLGIHVTSNFSYLVLGAVCLGALSAAVVAIRRGTTGRFLDAHGGSPAGAASVGVNATRHRFVVFVLGAAVAGFGGGLIASYAGFANYAQSFTFFFSLVWVAMVVTLGSRSAVAAAVGGVSFYLVPELLSRLSSDQSWANGVSFVLFGLGALTYARHPEGVIEAQATALGRRLAQVRRSRSTPIDQQPPEVHEGTHVVVGGLQ